MEICVIFGELNPKEYENITIRRTLFSQKSFVLTYQSVWLSIQFGLLHHPAALHPSGVDGGYALCGQGPSDNSIINHQ